MLVLSRKPGEKILIGDQVKVTIVRIGPNAVRLGIDAPDGMNIAREELLPEELRSVDPMSVDNREYQRAMAELRDKPRGRLRGEND